MREKAEYKNITITHKEISNPNTNSIASS